MDLLNLARTCKSLRDILMHRSSLFLWRAALRRVEDLPPCPADLTEPEYTNLVFYARCHVSTISLFCSKPYLWCRVVVKRLRQFYGRCAAGIVRPAELNGIVAMPP